jgi:hypothetical protein
MQHLVACGYVCCFKFALSDNELPGGIDTALLECLNHIVGLAVPLVNSGSRVAPGHWQMGILKLMLIGLALMYFLKIWD